jgi:CDP-glucose 4,6-dehydratase
MLSSLGCEVYGYSLPARESSLFKLIDGSKIVRNEKLEDIRNRQSLVEFTNEVQPNRIFHLAAQPLVRYGYRHPRETYEVNVSGTLNLLEAAKMCTSLESVVVVTTDKVYSDRPTAGGFVETDSLGGRDPYSASKAMADIMTQSWIHCNPALPLGVARAGNVIGGGDDCDERLMPDLISAYVTGAKPTLRNPDAVRPWQHVLDCLYGYLLLSDSLAEGSGRGTWNFGPEAHNSAKVSQVADLTADAFGLKRGWISETDSVLAETNLLALSSEKAKSWLGWYPVLDLSESIQLTRDWVVAANSGQSASTVTIQQTLEYFARVGYKPYQAPSPSQA